MPRKRKLDEVKSDERPTEGAYKCHVCGQSFYRGCGLASHIKKHAPVIFECTHCDYSCKHRPSYEKHFAMTHMNIMGSGPLVVIPKDSYEVQSVPKPVKDINQKVMKDNGKTEMKDNAIESIPNPSSKMTLRVTPKTTPKVAEKAIQKIPNKVISNTTNNTSSRLDSKPTSSFSLKRAAPGPAPVLMENKSLEKAIIETAITKKEVFVCPICPGKFSCSQRMAFHIMCHRSKLHQAPRGIKYYSKKLNEHFGFFKRRSLQLKKWRLRVDSRSADQKRAQRLWYMELNFGHSLGGYSKDSVMNKPSKLPSTSKANDQMDIASAAKKITRRKLKMKSGADFGQKVTVDGTHFYLCRECPYTSWNVTSLWRHFRNHAIRSKQGWTCISCSYSSAIRVRVDLHVKLHKDYTEDDTEYTSWVRYERRTIKSDLDKPIGRKNVDFDQALPSSPIKPVYKKIVPTTQTVTVPAPYVLPTRTTGFVLPAGNSLIRSSRKITDPNEMDMNAYIKYRQLNPNAPLKNDDGAEFVKECQERRFILPRDSKFAIPEMDDADLNSEEQPPQLEKMEDSPPTLMMQAKMSEDSSYSSSKSFTTIEEEPPQLICYTSISECSWSIGSPGKATSVTIDTETCTPPVLTPSELSPCAPPTLTPYKSISDANAEPVSVQLNASHKEVLKEPINKAANKTAGKTGNRPITFPIKKPMTRAMAKSGGTKPLTKEESDYVLDQVDNKRSKSAMKIEVIQEFESDAEEDVEPESESIIDHDDKPFKRPASRKEIELSMEPVRKSSRLSSKNHNLETEISVHVDEPIETTTDTNAQPSVQPLLEIESSENLSTKSSKESSVESMMQLSKQVSSDSSIEPMAGSATDSSRASSMEPLSRTSSPPVLFKEPLTMPKYKDFLNFDPNTILFDETRHHVDALDLFETAWMEYEKKVNVPVYVSAGIKFFRPLHPIAQAQVGRNNPKEYLLREIQIERSRECPECPFKNRDLKKFRLHRDRHFNGGRHRCNECSYASHNPHQVKDHMYVDHYLSDVRQAEGLPSSDSEEEETTPPPITIETKSPQKKNRRRRRANW